MFSNHTVCISSLNTFFLFLQVESLLGGLAAVQLLCTSCPKDVPAFLAGGGMRLLHQVVEEISGTSALLLFALTSVECTLRHASGCEEFSAQDKRILLSLLEKKQRPPVVSLLQRILQRLRCYELAVTITVIFIIIIVIISG